MHDKKELPSQEYLQECFTYDSITGKLYWKNRPRKHFKCDRGWKIFNVRYANKEAGNYRTGYLLVEFSERSYAIHRIIWKIVYGNDPETIDHINGNRADNRIENLRSIENIENYKNMKKYITNSSGVVGVSWNKGTGKWIANIRVNKKSKYLGVFSKMEDAIAARKSAEIEYGFHENHGRDY